MTDLEHILPLWRELEGAGAEYVLATVVAVEGSSYRKPGARMLIARDGRRAGTVSGGCLEAEVAKKAWWHTEDGPVVRRYSTMDDEGELPYGSGCGGVVYILLERRDTARTHLNKLEAAFHARCPIAIATVLEGPRIGSRAFAGLPEDADSSSAPEQEALRQLAHSALDAGASAEIPLPLEEAPTRVWVDYRAPRPGVWIFGAGDDAKPLVNMARQLGWFVAVVDGRAHLATRSRFPQADELHAIDIAGLPHAAPLPALRHGDAVLLKSHSFEQDTRVLAWLLAETGNFRAPYVGVLGPQRRTREALVHAARLLGINASEEHIDDWLEQLHAPTGLDLGAETPAAVALSILSEIQKVLHAGSARPLREVRATVAPTIAGQNR